jgi:peptide/nickel transport system substrate-binding protein
VPGTRPTLLTRRATLSLAATLAAGPARAAAKRLSLAVPRDIQGPLDPAYRLGALEANILRAVCPGLVANDEEGRIVQALAQTITTQSDTAIAFTLREGLEFHDGFGPVTAADVKFSFERFRRPGPDDALPPYAADWAVLDGVELTGPLSGILHLRAPSPMLWRTVLPDASGSIISRHALEEGLYRPQANGLRAPGAGHWRVGDWLPHQHLMLHSTAASTAFESIILRPVEQAKTAELAVRAGEVAFAAVPPEDLDSLRRVPGQAVIDRPADNLVWLGR